MSDLSILAVTLLKGVIYRDDDVGLWSSLLALQPQVRDYVAVLGLQLVLDEAEGHAFLCSRPEADETKIPRLVPRRPLSFPVSLLLALLRRRLAEFDAAGGDLRLVLTRDEIVELVRVFAAETPNEAKLRGEIESHIGKVVELGFLRKLKTDGAPTYEVRRILKAFVDARWLAGLDAQLAAYAEHLRGGDFRD